MHVIDAGWYGQEPNHWWKNVGDWTDGPWMVGTLKALAIAGRNMDARRRVTLLRQGLQALDGNPERPG